MPLTVIKGPPNSGRTEQVRREYMDLLPSGPILVVPSVDDIFDWERRLARGRDALLGGRIMHFKDLVSEVLSLKEGSRHKVASPLQRRHLVDVAFREAWPEMSERVRRQTGLADSMLRLIDEFRQSLIDPDTLDQRLAGLEIDSGYLRSISAVYRRYTQDLDRMRLTDVPALAMASSKVSLEAWQGRPVFLVGFDDLTEQQLELAARLGEQTNVTVAITHEDGNPAMAVTDRLLARLQERGAIVRDTTVRPLEPTEHSKILYEIERDFMRHAAGTLVPDDSISVMRSSGQRGEAEAVAARIAVLVDGGTDPGQIAIAVSAPAERGRVFRELLNQYSIPVSLESERSASETAVGRAALTLIRASSPSGSAADFIRYLRGPVGGSPELVDRLEFNVVRAGIESARQAAGMFERLGGTAPPGWAELTGGDKGDGHTASSISVAVLEMARLVLAGDRDAVPSDSTITEVQTARAISDACDELRSMGDSAAGPGEIGAAIVSGAIKTWGMPTVGSVRIASPYSLRAKRFEHLFMVSLQEGGLAVGDRSGPFISSDLRGQIGLPEFVDPELQELYLFYSCLSVPTRGLWLSCRIADESGKAEYPSPLVTAVESLFPEGSIRRHGRSAEDVVFRVSDAPSLDELARSLAANGATGQAVDITLTGVDEGRLASVEMRLASANETETSTRKLASISKSVADSVLAGKSTFSATALEAFTSCPYRWFFERALRPTRFGPEPEHWARGSLIHAVLAELYGNRTGRLPRADDIDEWLAAVEPAVNRLAAETEIGLGSDSPAHRVIRRQTIAVARRYLRIEAERDSPGFLPLMAEAGFGMEEGDEPVDMGSWSLRGSIDRVDVSGEAGVGLGQRGIVIDYKTGKNGTMSRVEIERGRKLQLQLYMSVLKRKWGIVPAAGLYVPVCRGSDGARGIVDSLADDDVADLDRHKADRVEDIAAEIALAEGEADRTALEILAGAIDHDPHRCINHLEHAAVPDPELWVAS